MHQSPFLSIIIPAYNEESRIGQTLTELDEFLRQWRRESEIIIVNDGSTDATANVVERYTGSLKSLLLINLPKNRGKGFAVQSGMVHARGNYQLFMDADHSVDIAYVDQFLTYCHKGYDIVIASIRVNGAKIIEQSQWYRRLLGHISKVLIRALVLRNFYDTQRGFKLFTRDAARRIFASQTIYGFGFDMELLLLAQKYGFTVKEVPVMWINKNGSSVGFRAYWKTLGELIWLKMRGV